MSRPRVTHAGEGVVIRIGARTHEVVLRYEHVTVEVGGERRTYTAREFLGLLDWYASDERKEGQRHGSG